jgi:hypothetical protein
MAQVFNSITNDYEFQMILMEKCIGNKQNPIIIDKLQVELSLKYERLSWVAGKTNDIYLMVEKALFMTQFKDKCQNCGNTGQKATDCKARRYKQQKVETQVKCNYFE